ncbi:UDP-3-O-[3-hydroxymyristoyl] N-acetylglucosamine deacetylase [Porphyromonadaceae bacterium KH3CP3RA]|nr:UDP-3-O-[3-hydroxymyristoyl] N-acetylglucosamine deacetylase [Porphyromonadaceae bacterium KH3CP3RA]
MVRQRTLNKKFSLRGKGLHTGQKVHITFHPAPEHFGYKIRRIDLPGRPVITASAENVRSTDRGTVLSDGDVRVGTVEHGLAALYGCGIDNCLIDVNAPEFPILDGSSIEFVNRIRQAGIRRQFAKRDYYIPKNRIEYRDEQSGAYLSLIPSDTFKIHTQICFDSDVLNVQSASLTDLSEFPDQIAMCRTFVFIKEIEPLLQNGLIKGGDLDNAIVIYDTPIPQEQFDRLADMMHVKRKNSSDLGYIMNTPLRFANEPARHKILDIIGDLSLSGKFIKGTIIAVRPGHRVNTGLARVILDDIRLTHAQNNRDTYPLKSKIV